LEATLEESDKVAVSYLPLCIARRITVSLSVVSADILMLSYIQGIDFHWLLEPSIEQHYCTMLRVVLFSPHRSSDHYVRGAVIAHH
jgi:hypothetical protein